MPREGFEPPLAGLRVRRLTAWPPRQVKPNKEHCRGDSNPVHRFERPAAHLLRSTAYRADRRGGNRTHFDLYVTQASIQQTPAGAPALGRPGPTERSASSARSVRGSDPRRAAPSCVEWRVDGQPTGLCQMMERMGIEPTTPSMRSSVAPLVHASPCFFRRWLVCFRRTSGGSRPRARRGAVCAKRREQPDAPRGAPEAGSHPTFGENKPTTCKYNGPGRNRTDLSFHAMEARPLGTFGPMRRLSELSRLASQRRSCGVETASVRHGCSSSSRFPREAPTGIRTRSPSLPRRNSALELWERWSSSAPGRSRTLRTQVRTPGWRPVPRARSVTSGAPGIRTRLVVSVQESRPPRAAPGPKENVERQTGFEPVPQGWKPWTLPLRHSRESPASDSNRARRFTRSDRAPARGVAGRKPPPGLEPRPPVYETGALPVELRGRIGTAGFEPAVAWVRTRCLTCLATSLYLCLSFWFLLQCDVGRDLGRPEGSVIRSPGFT